MKKVTLSLIIPCYNEEMRLPSRFDNAYQKITRYIKSFEIILVNDGSKDNTSNIIDDIAKRYQNVRIIDYKKNQGKGYAVKRGVLAAKGEILGFTDADFAISLEHLKDVLSLIDSGVDVVIGDRKNRKATLKNEPLLLRRMASFIHSRVNNFLLSLGDIYDTLCGFKFFKAEVARKLFKDLKVYRWFFDVEILLKARQSRLLIKKIPVNWEEVRGGQVRLIRGLISFIRDHLVLYTHFFNIRILIFLLSLSSFVLIFPFLNNPKELVVRNGDYSDLVWPNYQFIKRSIYEYGQIPLWNPTVFSGIPEIANPQSPILYPLNLITVVMPIEYGLLILLAIHSVIAGVFIYYLCKNLLKFNNFSSLITSFAFAFSPFFWSKVSVGHVSMFFAFMILAPILYYATYLIKKYKLRVFVLLSIFLSLQYLNYPTIWYYSIFFGLIFLFLLGIYTRQFKPLILIFIGAICSLVIILPIFLIQLQAGPLITRSELSLTDLAIPIWSIKRFVFSLFIPPNILNDLEVEVWIYPTLTILLFSLLGWRKIPKKLKLIGLFILILAVLITLGNRTPFFYMLVKHVPGFSYLRVSTRDWFVVITILILLSGYFINSLKGRLAYLLGTILIVESLMFTSFRLWFVPEVMQQTKDNKRSELLIESDKYRYFCTTRCLSGSITISRGINTADGYHLLILKNYRDILSDAGGFLPPKYTGNIPAYESFGSQPSSDKLGKLSVKYVISNYLLLDSGFEKIKEKDGYILYRNDNVVERFRFQSVPENLISIKRDSPNIIELVTDGEEDKLIISDPYYPGWKAYIDGNEVLIEKYDDWAKMINIPRGSHELKLIFNPFNIL